MIPPVQEVLISREAIAAKIRELAQVINAANGITMAQHYHINRLPAVLINRKVVVYGMTDVGAAIERAGGRR